MSIIFGVDRYQNIPPPHHPYIPSLLGTSSPLTPAVGSMIDEGAYTRTLITYSVETGERVSAWLLMPQEAAPPDGWPAVLAIHQHDNHYDLGKAEPTGLAGNAMYAYGKEICQRGYVVLCPDLLCFEDRRPAYEVRQANRALDDAGFERFEFTRRLLAGSCLQTKYLHDLTCTVNLLASLPEVNRERLGVIGHSLGGLEALWLTWYDARITAAVSSCGFGCCTKYILSPPFPHRGDDGDRAPPRNTPLPFTLAWS